jgi:hypothetical protein
MWEVNGDCFRSVCGLFLGKVVDRVSIGALRICTNCMDFFHYSYFS